MKSTKTSIAYKDTIYYNLIHKYTLAAFVHKCLLYETVEGLSFLYVFKAII